MDKKTVIVLACGIILTLLLFFISPYLAGMAIIITAVLVMSLMIMQDTLGLPALDVQLKDDARGIVLRNSGNSPALNIHVSLVPLNRDYSLLSLGVDESHEFPLDEMIQAVKVITTFENESGGTFSQTVKLSSSGDEFEPLKPVIPLFKWK